MKNEELVMVIKDLIKHLDESIKLQNENASFYRGLIQHGLIYQKKSYMNRQSNTSFISIPKRLSGKAFKVVLIPIDEADAYMTELPKRFGPKAKAASDAEIKLGNNPARINLLDVDNRKALGVSTGDFS
jgi:hypothetical protein